MENAIMLKQLQVRGNVPCLTCGHGHYCEMSGAPAVLGSHAAATVENCQLVEDQPVWHEARVTGELVGQLIRGEKRFNRKRYQFQVTKMMLPKMLEFKAASRWHRSGLKKVTLRKEK